MAKKITYRIAGFILALFSITSCLKTKENQCSSVLQGSIDSVHAPVRVNLNDSIIITIFTTLSDGCQNVQPLVPMVTGNNTRLPLLIASNGCVCTQVISNTSTNYAIRALQRGSFTFELVDAQRTITKTVEVL